MICDKCKVILKKENEYWYCPGCRALNEMDV
jgi:lipopolysaccharide biosynthesis regulator YciM